MTNNKFDKIAKTLRKNRDISIKQLAEFLELTPGNIQNIENGKKIVTDDIIDKYMEVFNQKEEQSFILSSSSDKNIDDYINIDFDNANSNQGLKLIPLYPIIDPKIILDTFSTCEHYGYNFDPSIISDASKYVKVFYSTIIDYRKEYKIKDTLSRFEWEQTILDYRIRLYESIGIIKENNCSIFYQKAGFLCNENMFEDTPDSEDYAESIYYPLISIVRNDSGFIMEKSGSGQTILKMPAALIMPDDLGYSCYDVV